MTSDEAERTARRLAAEHPDRATHVWLPRERAGAWEVVKVRAPHGAGRPELRPVVEAQERPPQADDPRPAPFRQVPPYG